MNAFLMLLSIGFAFLGLLCILIGVAFHQGNKEKDFSKRWWQSDELKVAGLAVLCFLLSYCFWP